MPRLGPWELIIILLIVLLVFGAGKLPQIGSAIGKSIREFKKQSKGDADEEEAVAKSKPAEEKAEKPVKTGS